MSTQSTQTNWEIALNYGKIYYIKSKNPKRTLSKILSKTNKPDEVAIKPPRSYYWYVITEIEKLERLIDGEEIETVIIFHYPPRGGDGVGKGWLKLP